MSNSLSAKCLLVFLVTLSLTLLCLTERRGVLSECAPSAKVIQLRQDSGLRIHLPDIRGDVIEVIYSSLSDCNKLLNPIAMHYIFYSLVPKKFKVG